MLFRSRLAREFHLPTANKKDSQGLCFIGKIDIKDFLTHYIKVEKGDVLNTKGEVVGEHDGSILYAIGQRHGFTIKKKSSEDPRFFVVSKDIEKNTINVESEEKRADSSLTTKEIVLSSLHLINPGESMTDISVRIRYRQEKQSCIIEKINNEYHVTFNTPQVGVSVGQSAVFYNGNVCLGGGIIEKAF